MQKLWIKLLAPAVLLAVTTVVWSQPPDPNAKPDTKPAPAKDKEAPAKSQLEQMLEIALKSNPDIRVAEAKSREADAELSRARLAVTRKVVLLYNNLETARANVKRNEAQLQRMRSLKNAVSQMDLDEMEAKFVQAKADLAKLEAEIPYLLGQQKLKWQKDADGKLHLVVEASAEENYKDVLDRLEAARLMQGAGTELRLETREPNKAISDKLRAALDKGPMEIVITKGWGPQDALDFLRDKYGIEMNILVKDSALVFPEGEGGRRLNDVTFGALLQWMEDSLPKHSFVVRDYGLVLMRRDQIPPNAMLLDDFMKSRDKDAKPKAKEEKK